MCFIPPHYIIPIFPLCWMAIGHPYAKLRKQQHLASWQILQADLLPASKLCLGLLHGLAADGLSGLPRASGSRSWLSFDAEDFTHFYSFVKTGPSKCFMKQTLENINGSNFAFEKAEVSVYLDRRRGILKMGLHVSMCLNMNFYSKELGNKPMACYDLSLPPDEAVWFPGETETWESSGFLGSVKPPISFVFSINQIPRKQTHITKAPSSSLLCHIMAHVSVGLYHGYEEG